MTGDVQILEALQAQIANVYFNKFPQAISVVEATPKVLVQNMTQNSANTKDKLQDHEYTYRVTIVGTNYMNISSVADEIANVLISYTDNTVYLINFEGSNYDSDDTLEVHRIVQDYRAFIKQDNGS